MSWIFGILILGGVIAFIYVRTRSSPTPAQPLASTGLPATPGRIQPTTENIWGKRLVVNDPGACFAARALAGQYFPLDHVPGLPFKDYNHADSIEEEKIGTWWETTSVVAYDGFFLRV